MQHFREKTQLAYSSTQQNITSDHLSTTVGELIVWLLTLIQ